MSKQHNEIANSNICIYTHMYLLYRQRDRKDNFTYVHTRLVNWRAGLKLKVVTYGFE